MSHGSTAPAQASASSAQTAKALLPGAKADAAARAGGGISPYFLANVVGQQAGEPGAGLGILADIQKSLGGAGTVGGG